MSTALETQPIEIFRAGNYGAKGNYTVADLDRIIASYDPAVHEAPAVIGHPETNGPAWGWAKKLSRNGEILLAQFGEVDPTFAGMVEAGRFKKRSASFYREPGTGKVTGLRHVGFLGAKPPDIKGLKDVQFDDAGREVAEVTFEESDMAEQNKQLEDSLFERLKALFTPKSEPAAATVGFSEEQLQAAVNKAIEPFKKDIEKQKADFADSQKTQETAASKSRAADAIAKLKREGKYLPAFDKMGLSVVFDELATRTETVEFGEGDTKQKKSPLEFFVEFMEKLPKFVPAGHVYDGQQSSAKTGAVANFNEGRSKADPNSVALDSKVRERMSSKSISYGDALSQVTREHPELTKPGGASGGEV
jgi:hypothetical protein